MALKNKNEEKPLFLFGITSSIINATSIGYFTALDVILPIIYIQLNNYYSYFNFNIKLFSPF